MTKISSLFTAILKNRIWIAMWNVFSRLFIMLGLPLLGWGFANVQGFVSNPARAGIATIAIVLALQSGVAVYYMPPIKIRSPHEEEHWHYSLLEIGFLLSAYGDRRDILVWSENTTLRWVGVGIYFLGFLYAAWTNLTWVKHMRNEPERADDPPALLPVGPFSWTRYPMMTSLLCYHAGFTLAFRSWMGVVFALPILYVLVRRVKIWDAAYAARYPKEWRMREQNSKRVIPFLY